MLFKPSNNIHTAGSKGSGGGTPTVVQMVGLREDEGDSYKFKGNGQHGTRVVELVGGIHIAANDDLDLMVQGLSLWNISLTRIHFTDSLKHMVLRSMEFLLHFINLITHCFTYISNSVIIKGEASPKFILDRGLHQGEDERDIQFAAAATPAPNSRN